MYRKHFDWALKAAWVDAKMVMDELNAHEVVRFNPNVTVADLRPSGRANNFMYGW